MPGPIIPIGGGEIRDLETLPIDREAVRLTKKKKPNALFIPTASRDAAGYCDAFHDVYGRMLGCKTEVLRLVNEKSTKKVMKEKIAWADVIYVGGGNTLFMMNTWRRLGVDKELKRAWQQGTVMAGLSAGSICWFEKGLSDSRAGRWTRVTGLGLIPALHSPHFTREPARREAFKEMMLKEKIGTVGYGIEDGCAIVFADGEERIVRADKNAKVWKYVKEAGKEVSVIKL